jgi:hypothetical protein
MSIEIKLTAKGETEQKVLKHLQDNASEALAEKINAGDKTIAGALDYCKGEARKLAHGDGCVAVEDETVFGWIMHYFEEGEIKEKAKKPAFTAPAGVSMRKEPEVKKATKPQVVAVKDQKSMFASLFN